jgi:soluble lytic murein transglycosylase-like protein
MINVNQITSTLRGLPDRALQQYAMMHKGDPYILALAVSESNQRKQMRMAGQGQAGAMPQPKVADAAIASMAQQQLPEDQGIARIPAPNIQSMADGGIAGYGDGDDVPRKNGMAQGGMYDFAQRSEPVVRMAGGGMPGYKNGKDIKVYEDRIRAEAARQGVDPDLAVRMFITESGGKKDAVSPKGAAGLGQLMIPAAKEMGLTPAERFDPDKNIPASIGYLKKQLVKYDGDTEKALAAYNWGPGSVDKHLAKNQGKLNKAGLPKETADYLTKILPVGTAVAEEVPGAKKPQAAIPVDTSTAAQIPGQTVKAPASNYDQTNSFFGRIADRMGIPLEAQRQIGTTLNAPTPLAAFSGAYAAPTKAGSSGIAALGEKVADKLGLLKGPAGSMSKADIAALKAETAAAKNEQAGLRALENSQLAIKDAQSAGATLDEQEYLRKMMEANRIKQTTSAADKISDASLIREGDDVATAQRLMKTTEQAQTAGRADALTDKALSATQQAPQAAPSYNPNKMEPVRFDEFDPSELSKPAEKEVIDAAKEATPVKERKGFNNDDLLTLGLSLLASKSPNFMTALGEAGLATVAGKKEREKTEREEAKLKGAEELQKAQAKYYGAYAGAIERGAKEKNDELQAEQAVQKYMENWDKSMANKIGSVNDPAARVRAEEEYRQRIYAQLGITPIMGKQSASSAANPDPLGILGKR